MAHKLPALLTAAALGAAVFLSAAASPGVSRQNEATAPPECGLTRIDPYGKHTGERCPLKHTAVRAEISGSLARVTVTQEFENTSPEKIEAVYTFPLPQRAAVDGMTMKVGERTIQAVIKKRDEARRIFEEARAQGHVASLLEQERPNIFTQSVTNIDPKAKVQVTLTYVELLNYEEGAYEFSYPMVVGPRYMPGAATGKQGAGWSPDTTQVPDASRISPKYAPPETRAGHDLSLEVAIDAGVPITVLRSKTHEVDISQAAPSRAVVKLRARAVIPNKDFVLRYDVAGGKVEDALLYHRGARGGFFSLILQPPARVTAEDVAPKELVFVLDTSGSMSGFPIEKAKETMKLALAGLYPRDTFNLITFSGDTRILFPKPVPATAENLRQAQALLAGQHGGGGTEMMKAVRAALEPSGDPEKVRIVCFMTDGYVGNDMEILAEVRKNAAARVFSFGIGSSVNRFLLDRMAEEGRGEVEYVGLNEDGSAAARRFHERVRNPLLTDVSVEWNGLPVAEVFPGRVPDLFSAKPLVLSGRYTAAASGTITIRGRMSGRPWSRNVRVALPAGEPAHDVLATLWARAKVDDLMRQDWAGLQSGRPKAEVEQEITRLGLEFRLMTQFTSFVAVETKTVTRDGKPVVVEVPVEMPEGVSHEGVFGADAASQAAFAPMAARKMAFNTTDAVAARGAVRAREAVSNLPRSAQIAEKDERKADASKLDAKLAALASGGDPTLQVEVEVWLTEASPAAMERLRKLGFVETATPKVAKIRRGRLAAGKLLELSALPEVVTVTAAEPR